MSLEKLVGKGGPRYWFKEKNPEPPQQQPEGGEESVTEDDPATEVPATGMSEDDPEEMETGQKMWLVEKVTTLEKENGELKKALHEMETRLAIQENVMKQADD